MKPPFLRAQYNYDTAAASNETAIDCTIDVMTGKKLKDVGGAKQSFKDECDLNWIIARHGIGYEIPEGTRLPQWGDFTGINSLHEALSQVAMAREGFDALPADVRTRFDNDPVKFVNFTADDKNREALGEMQLLSKEAVERIRKAADAAKAAAQADAAILAEAKAKAAHQGQAPAAAAKQS